MSYFLKQTKAKLIDKEQGSKEKQTLRSPPHLGTITSKEAYYGKDTHGRKQLDFSPCTALYRFT